jgi:hypothetical protein
VKEAKTQNDKAAQCTTQANNALQQEKQSEDITTAGVGSERELIALFNPKIHVCDIGDFAQLGFDKQSEKACSEQHA